MSRRPLELLILTTVVMIVVAIVSLQSLVGLVLWGGVYALLHGLLFPEETRAKGLAVYMLYATITVILFLAQFWTNPAYFGFSGGIGVGTDDFWFYSIVAGNMPDIFPQRLGAHFPGHVYADLLKIAAWPFNSLFGTVKPLDLLFFNAMGLAFAPFLAAGLARGLGGGEKTVSIAFRTTLLCPFLLGNSLILMRDGLVAVMFGGALWGLVGRRWVLAAICVAGVFWMRVGTGLLLLGTIMMLGFFIWNSTTINGIPRLRVTWSGLGLTAAAIVIVIVASRLFGQQAGDSPAGLQLFRADFLQSFMARGASNDTGTSSFYFILQLPLPLRLPLAFAFFLGSPYFAVTAFHVQGLWVPRAFMFNTFSLLFIVYVAWFVRGAARAFRERHALMIGLLLVLVIDLLLISQASMQMRHKMPMMILFYVIVGYGVRNTHKGDRSLGWMASGAVLLVNVVMNVLQVFRT